MNTILPYQKIYQLSCNPESFGIYSWSNHPMHFTMVHSKIKNAQSSVDNVKCVNFHTTHYSALKSESCMKIVSGLQVLMAGALCK